MNVCRVLVLVFVALVVAWPAPSRAANFQYADRQLAYAACASAAAAWETANPNPAHPMVCTSNISRTPSTGFEDYGMCNTNSPFNETATCWTNFKNTYEYPKANNGCPAGAYWIPETHKCFSPEVCLARNAELGVNAGLPRPSLTTSRCVADCEFAMQTSGDQYSVTSWQGQSLYRGVMEYTGNPCTVSPTSPDGQVDDQKQMPPQECLSVAGQNVCVKPNGDQCYSGPIGRPMQFCWRPGETGNKSSGDVNQARAAGSTAPTAPTPPVGDSFQSADSPMTTNTSTGSGVVINTTVQNYTTVNGVNAGPVNQGELPDGTGSPGSAGGSSGGTGSDSSSASGGGDCKGAPIVSDPALAMIATQAWATRCAVEAGNAAKVTGDVANCTQPFTVEGSNANAVKLRAMRAEICKDDANGNGQPDWTEGDAPGVPGEGDPEVGDPPGPPSEVGVSTGLLDMSGILGGAATCPALGVLDFGEFGTFDLNSESVWCDLVDVMRAVVLLMAAFAAIKILMGGK